MTPQRARDAQAKLLVHDWALNGVTGPEMLQELRHYASRSHSLHFTPHLVTAIREAGMWPVLQRAELETT